MMNMAGFSVVLLMMSFLFIFMIILFFFVVTSILLTYILESITLMKMSQKLKYKTPKVAFIPFYNKWILGKIANDKILGMILAIDDMIILITWICDIILSQYHTIVAGILYICVFISFILNIVLTHKIYKRFQDRNGNLYTLLSVLTFGFLRPIFLFVSSNKKEENMDRVEK